MPVIDLEDDNLVGIWFSDNRFLCRQCCDVDDLEHFDKNGIAVYDTNDYPDKVFICDKCDEKMD